MQFPIRDIHSHFILQPKVIIPKRQTRSFKSTQPLANAQELAITEKDVTRINNTILAKTRRKLLKNPILQSQQIVPERQEVQKFEYTASAKKITKTPTAIPTIVINEEDPIVVKRRYPPQRNVSLTMDQMIQLEHPKIGTPKPLPPQKWTVV